jgi:hypothetical protein
MHWPSRAALVPFTASLLFAFPSHSPAQSSPAPLLAPDYASRIDTALRGKDTAAVLSASQAMLAAVPYDTTVDQALNEALRSLQPAFTAEALTLYAAREPYIVAGLRAGKPCPADPTAPVVSLATLYADGLAYAALEQFAGKPGEAAATVQELDAALAVASTPLQPDDAIRIAAARRQYALLGQPLPPIPLAVSLYSEHETPHINTDYGASTVLFLFPPECAQCVRMGQDFGRTLYRLSEHNVHLYGLLAQEPPPVPAMPEVIVHSDGSMSPAKRSKAARSRANAAVETAPAAAPPRTAAELLHHTPTLIVPVGTLQQFAASSFPLLIATDSRGIIRFIQAAPETALNPGDFLDQVTAHIAAQWPRIQPPDPAHP